MTADRPKRHERQQEKPTPERQANKHKTTNKKRSVGVERNAALFLTFKGDCPARLLARRSARKGILRKQTEDAQLSAEFLPALVV